MYHEFLAYKHSGYALQLPKRCAAMFQVMTAIVASCI